MKFTVPLLDLNINKMVPGCPWRHQQKIYLQVHISSLSLSLSPFLPLPSHLPSDLVFLFFLFTFHFTGFVVMQVVYPVGRKYVSAPSAPRLKLGSTSELKTLFSIEDVKLPSWLDGM